MHSATDGLKNCCREKPKQGDKALAEGGKAERVHDVRKADCFLNNSKDSLTYMI